MRLTLFLLFITTFQVFAQENQPTLSGQNQLFKVTGKVTDAEGSPIPGVSILLKGTMLGTISNLDGVYTLSDVPDNSVLVFSFVGMLTQEVHFSGQTTIDLTMEEDRIKLDELVVVGYGTQSKRFVAGSIASVDMEEKKTLTPMTNVSQALKDIAGVQFIDNGRPGQDGKLLIRGQNSLGTKTDPLIVIDGIIFEGSLSDINPQDIESMDVLKDAASTAIYGSKAANGVIMISSKKGTRSKPEIRVNATQSIYNAERWLNMPTEERFLQRKRDYYTQQLEIAGNDPGIDINDVSELLKPEEYENYLAGKYMSYEDIVGRQGQLSTVDLSISGGSDKTSYMFSGSFNDNTGLIKGDQETRYSFRMNLETKITDWISIGTASFFTYRDLSGKIVDLSDAYDNSPYGNFYYTDGNVKFNPVSSDASTYNALYYYELTDNTELKKNLFSNMFINVDFPFLKGLSYRMNYSPNFEWQNNYSFVSQDPYSAGNTTKAEKKNKNINRWVWENIIKYNQTFADIHDVDVTLMYGRNKYFMEETNVEASLFEVDILGYNQFGLGSNYSIKTPAEERFDISSLARLNYTLMKKYMISMAVRRDGSSVFGKNNKFGLFPSAAVSWIASEESFLSDINALNFLKFRMSYGESGNSDITPYLTQSLNEIKYNTIGDNSGSPIAFLPKIGVMGNEDIRWETTKSFNLGFDFGVLDNRISGSVDWYNKSTIDLLVDRSIPSSNGYQKTWDNIGEVNNRGIEIALNTLNIDGSEFSWSSSFSFAFNKNKIVHLFGDIDGDGIEDDAKDNGWFIGENIDAFYDYEFDGIFQNYDTIGGVSYLPGDIKLVDHSGNDTIDDEDRTIVGHGRYPDYSFTISNTFKYGNLSLYFSINSMLGWSAPFDLVYAHGIDQPMNCLDVDYWTAENKSNTYPSLLYSNSAHKNHYYVSRNFLRIKDVALSYDLRFPDTPVLSKFSSLRVTFSIKNLYTFTKWLGPDPENAGLDPEGRMDDGITSNKGSDRLFPMPRTYSIGINMSF